MQKPMGLICNSSACIALPAPEKLVIATAVDNYPQKLDISSPLLDETFAIYRRLFASFGRLIRNSWTKIRLTC